MQEFATEKDNAQRFSLIWWKSRTDAGKSQEYMAKHLGISKRTVQNWEHGVTCPNLFQSSEWFRLLGQNPLHYYLSYLHPGMLRDDSSYDEAEIDEALMLLISNSTPKEKRELLFLMSGQHGSSWHSLLQLFTAHCHTSLRSRVTAARVIVDSYEMEEHTGDLVCPDAVQPDMDMLNMATGRGKRAVQEKKKGYTIQ